MSENFPYNVISAEIYNIIEESPTIRTLQLKPEEPIKFKTGQFIEVTVPDVGEAPFTPSSSHEIEEKMDITVMKTGFVTDYIHQAEEGDVVGIRGPFGSNYPLDKWENKDILIMGGGVGMAPTRSLFLTLLDNIENFNTVTFLVGAKTPEDMIFKRFNEKWKNIDKVQFIRACDEVLEGQEWSEHVCLITELLEEIDFAPDNNPAVVCGPPVMMKFSTLDLLEKGFSEENIYLSMEKKMYCGHGQCRHCLIGDLYSCKDGPVFTYNKIKNKENLWE